MRVRLVPVFLLRQLLESMLGRRAGQGPFQRVGIFIPVIILGHFRATPQGVGHDAEEQQER